MSRAGDYGGRLYRGEVSYDFVGRQRRWYTISAIVILVSLGALLFRGLTLSFEFRGGSQFQFPAASTSVVDVRSFVNSQGINGATVQQIGSGSSTQYKIETDKLTNATKTALVGAISSHYNVDPTKINADFVSASWGKQITTKAAQGLVVFLIAVVIFISAYFRDWKMAVAGIVALIHDLIITVGIYALVGFEVAPSTVIGVLTILGYSLYDTVVVFDKVRENTAGISSTARITYSQAANLAVNQTLVRSINTSLTALLPVAAILFVGAGLLGAGTLKDLSLALLVGIATGTYSSIFIATPLLADLREREPAMKALAARVAAKQGKGAVLVGSPALAGAGGPVVGGDLSDSDVAAATPPPAATGSRPARPAGPRNQPRRGGSPRGKPSGKRKR